MADGAYDEINIYEGTFFINDEKLSHWSLIRTVCLQTANHNCDKKPFLNSSPTDALDSVLFLKKIDKCWQDHCRQMVSLL